MPNVLVGSVRHSTIPLAEPTEKGPPQIGRLSYRGLGASLGSREALAGSVSTGAVSPPHRTGALPDRSR